jgi:O-acetylhomoserine/O-acetylserine sulfhydrylase-like pyridoxal-dependent enzyme
METLACAWRAFGECARARRWLESHSGVERVLYPASSRTSAQARDAPAVRGGALLSFVVKGGREARGA